MLSEVAEKLPMQCVQGNTSIQGEFVSVPYLVKIEIGLKDLWFSCLNTGTV